MQQKPGNPLCHTNWSETLCQNLLHPKLSLQNGIFNRN